MNCLLTSLLNKYNDFYLSIVDLKQVEFLEFSDSPRLAVPIVTSAADCQSLLEKYINLMHFHFNILASKRYKNIDEFNKNENVKMYRHVIVIDELATVLLNNKIIKTQLQELLQLGRAVGIHLILCTQAPNCKTIPTELKININNRIALAVPTVSNSKIILDEAGAEKLSGKGQAILKQGTISKNFQCAIVE